SAHVRQPDCCIDRFGVTPPDRPGKNLLSGVVADIGIEQVGCSSPKSADFSNAREGHDDGLDALDLRVREATWLPRRPTCQLNIAVGKEQRRRQIIRDPFVLQLPEHRKIDGAIGVCKAPPDRHPASVNLSDGTTPEFRSLNQVKWSLSYVDAGSRTPNEPTAHNLW